LQKPVSEKATYQVLTQHCDIRNFPAGKAAFLESLTRRRRNSARNKTVLRHPIGQQILIDLFVPQPQLSLAW